MSCVMNTAEMPSASLASEIGGVLKTGEEITEVLMVREVLSAEDRVVRHLIKEVRG